MSTAKTAPSEDVESTSSANNDNDEADLGDSEHARKAEYYRGIFNMVGKNRSFILSN